MKILSNKKYDEIMTNWEKKVKDLNKKVDDKDREIFSLNKDIEKKDKEITKSNKNIHDLEDKLAYQTAENIKIKGNLDNQNKINFDLNNEIIELKKELEENKKPTIIITPETPKLLTKNLKDKTKKEVEKKSLKPKTTRNIHGEIEQPQIKKRGRKPKNEAKQK